MIILFISETCWIFDRKRRQKVGLVVARSVATDCTSVLYQYTKKKGIYLTFSVRKSPL